jgi:thiol-activated cytolysin
MKNSIKIATITLGLIVIASCSKSDDSKSSIEMLKPVDFVATPDVVVKTEQSSRAYPNSANGGNSEYLTITTTQKSGKADPVSPAFSTDTSLIFPGSILRGSSFIKGDYDPLVLSNAFNKVTLSTSLKGATTVFGEYFPTISGMQTGINDLVVLKAQEINYNYIPAILSYDSKEVTTNESLVKSMNIHATLDLKFVAASVAAKFGYVKKETSTVGTRTVMISFRQKLYSASIDPKYYSDWITGGINTAQCGDYEPLYISNVDYGRIAYVLFETTLTKDELYSQVTASLTASYKAVANLSASAEWTTEAGRVFSQNTFKAYIYGGPLNGGIITSLEGLADFLKKPTPQELVGGSAPISYTVRRLKDNTKVEIRSVYTEETAAFRP